MSSSRKEKEKEGEAQEQRLPCAGCKHLRRRCVPTCSFAPYFPPDDADRFAAVHNTYGASNLAKLLGELPKEQRADAVESLVFQAQERLEDPTTGCVGYISILQNLIKQNEDRVSAVREELAKHVGRDAAFQPLDPAAAPEAARQVADARHAEMLRLARDQVKVVRTKMQAKAQAQGAAAKQKQKQKQQTNQQTVGGQAARAHALVMPQRSEQAVAQYGGTGPGFPDGPPRQTTAQASASSATAAAAAQAARERAWMMQMQQNRNRVLHQGTGLAVPVQNGRGHGQMIQQQVAVEQRSVDEVARGQDAMLRRQIAAGMQNVMPQQMNNEAARQRDMMMPDRQQADAEEQYNNAAMAQAMAEEIRKAADAAGVTSDQYMKLMMTLLQNLADGQKQQQQHRGEAEQYGATGMRRDPNMAMMQQVVGGQQQLPMARQIANAQQISAAAQLEQQQPMARQIPDAQQISAAAQFDMQEELMQQMNEAARQRDMMMPVRREADTEEQYYNATMAQAAAEEIRQADDAAGLTVEEMEKLLMMMPEDVAGGQQQQHHRGQAEQYGSTGMTTDPNMAMMQQVVDGQQQQPMARQIANSQQIPGAAELDMQEELMQELLDAAYGNAMPGNGSGSGATIRPFQQPTGTANTDAFLAEQQRQLQPPRHTVNVQFQEESPSLPALPAWQAGLQPRQQQSFRPGRPVNNEAFLFRQQPQPQPQRQTVNVQVQEPAWLTGLQPLQQQSFRRGGPATNGEAFLFQQQPQPQTLMVNVQVQEQPSLRPWWAGLSPRQQQTFLSGAGLADSQAFLVQQQPPQQQRVNSLRSQMEPSLPPPRPSLADLSHQQQDDGDDDLIATYWNLPTDGRQ